MTLMDIRVSMDLDQLIAIIMVCLGIGSLAAYMLFKRDIER